MEAGEAKEAQNTVVTINPVDGSQTVLVNNELFITFWWLNLFIITLTQLHLGRPKLHRVLAVLSAVGLRVHSGEATIFIFASFLNVGQHKGKNMLL